MINLSYPTLFFLQGFNQKQNVPFFPASKCYGAERQQLLQPTPAAAASCKIQKFHMAKIQAC